MDEAPYSELRPDEEIDAVFSGLSVVSRMTNDVYMMMLVNKVLIELKRQISDMVN